MLPATVGTILAYSAVSSRTTNVTNNTIVYSDTVLNLKDLGSNIKVQSVSNVGECSFESCVETICKSNPNITFNTIQYSRADKKVYFYTDSAISTKEWNERDITEKTYSTVNVEVLEDLKNIFANQQECPRDAVSIYNVMLLSATTYKKIAIILETFKERLNSILKDESSDYYYYIRDFDYNNKEMSINIHFRDWCSAKFKKENGDLYISECDSSPHEDDILPLLGRCLSELYDTFLTFEYFYTERNKPKALNSGFIVEIDKYGVDLIIPNGWIGREFELSHRNSWNKYNCTCNSNNIIESLKGKESELFKRIFVKIEDCPKWMKPTLYNLRQEQLQREQEQLEKQAKKEKRLELVRKVLPFTKK